MTKQLFYFAHANGFPGACYKKLFAYLAKDNPDYEIHYADALGHNPNYPVSDNWDFLVEELIDSILVYGKQPIIGIGHSLGGVLHYLASCQRPDLYKQIILLDSPIFGRIKSALIRTIKQIGLIDKMTPAARTRTRRRHWPDVESAIAYLKDKAVFTKFDPDCLRDYVTYGTEVTPEGLQLRFNPQIEYRIYKTLPHTLGHHKQSLKIPMALIYGVDSDVVTALDIIAMRLNYKDVIFHKIKGDHLFPFEYPELTARVIKKLVARRW